MNNRFLITGGAGFIGSHLVEALSARGHSVAIIDNLNDFYSPLLKARNLQVCLKSPNVRHYNASVGDRSALEEIFEKETPDTVVHLAATAGVRTSFADPIHYIDNNLRALQVLLNTFEKHRIKKLLFASSSSVYGASEEIPYSESGPVFPISPYAVTKMAGEYLCNIYAARFGFDMAKLRFFSVYGPRQRPDMAIAKFADLIMADKPLPINGSLELARDYTYVEDIVRAIVACTERETGGRAINLGRSVPVTLRDAIQLLGDAMGKTPKLDMRAIVQGEPSVTCADISVAAKLLGYEPQVELEEGIRRYVAWYRESSNHPLSASGGK